MILYQDANSIVKKYLRDERGLPATQAAVDRADFVATSLISYAEVRAALIRARRANRISSQNEYTRLIRGFNRDWTNYFKIAVTNSVVHMAGDIAETHALKGFDSIHLAACLSLEARVPDSIEFSTWDIRLANAAQTEGFVLAHEVIT
jgi:predicted nucleic acid-binding protein